jgi:hypothetical protein
MNTALDLKLAVSCTQREARMGPVGAWFRSLRFQQVSPTTGGTALVCAPDTVATTDEIPSL